MLMLRTGELQIRPNGEWSDPSGQKSCKSVQIMQIFSARAENGGWLIFNSKLRIENAYAQFGRIANSHERGMDGFA